MIKKLNKDSYLDMSINQLEQRLEMQSLLVGTNGVTCESNYCETWARTTCEGFEYTT